MLGRVHLMMGFWNPNKITDLPAENIFNEAEADCLPNQGYSAVRQLETARLVCPGTRCNHQPSDRFWRSGSLNEFLNGLGEEFDKMTQGP